MCTGSITCVGDSLKTLEKFFRITNRLLCASTTQIRMLISMARAVVKKTSINSNTG